MVPWYCAVLLYSLIVACYCILLTRVFRVYYYGVWLLHIVIVHGLLSIVVVSYSSVLLFLMALSIVVKYRHCALLLDIAIVSRRCVVLVYNVIVSCNCALLLYTGIAQCCCILLLRPDRVCCYCIVHSYIASCALILCIDVGYYVCVLLLRIVIASCPPGISVYNTADCCYCAMLRCIAIVYWY